MRKTPQNSRPPDGAARLTAASHSGTPGTLSGSRLIRGVGVVGNTPQKYTHTHSCARRKINASIKNGFSVGESASRLERDGCGAGDREESEASRNRQSQQLTPGKLCV